MNLPVANVHGGTGTEGPSGTVPFAVSLSRPPASGNVTIGYQTVDRSAVAGTDYTATSGTLTFTPTGTVSQTVNVPLIDNNTTQPTRTLGLSLTSLNGAVAGTSTDGRILDDDMVGVRARCSSVAAGLTLPCWVTVLSQPHVPISVAYHTTDGTATSPVSYAAASGLLTFAPGDQLTKEVDITTVNGAAATDTSQFSFSATLTGTPTSTAIATIIDSHRTGCCRRLDRRRERRTSRRRGRRRTRSR